MPATKIPYRPRGASEEVFFCGDPEVLLEGPAGTGKTRGTLEWVHWLCVTYPGVRILLVRKTRASLTESICVTWETKVLPPNAACLKKGGSAEQRHAYEFPFASNTVDGHRYMGRSKVVLGGMDKASRVLSTEYDVIIAFEAVELTEEDWETLLTRNRNWHLPWQQAVAETNPGPREHWLNKRANRPLAWSLDVEAVLGKPREDQKQMTRLISRHKDNPALWDEEAQRWTVLGAPYMAKLQSLTGPRRGRLLLGEWVSSEGQVWEIFDRAKHMVFRKALDLEGKVAAQDGHRRDAQGNLVFDWYFASFDWGHRAPGCLQIWGVVGKCERIYRIHEVYRRAFQLDAWAEQVARFHKRYTLASVVCDPSRPDLIEFLNRRLTEIEGRDVGYVAIPGVQEKAVRVDTVRYGLVPGEGLGAGELAPRLYLCWDALELAEHELRDEHKPTCTEDEIPDYVWAKWAEGKPLKEETDRTCADHGCDAMSYAAVWAFGKDLTPPAPRIPLQPDSLGAILGHDEVRFDQAA